jgi:hypothetical protein
MLRARQLARTSLRLKSVRVFLLSFLILGFHLPAAGQAETCKPNQGALALSFAQIRAKLAVAAGRCMGYARDVDAQQFSRFLTRHKEWAIKGDEWSGAELLKINQAKGAPRTVGAQHYYNLLHQEQEAARQSAMTKYCGEALELYRQWVDTDAIAFREKLKVAACHQPRLDVATTPAGN